MKSTPQLTSEESRRALGASDVRLKQQQTKMASKRKNTKGTQVTPKIVNNREEIQEEKIDELKAEIAELKRKLAGNDEIANLKKKIANQEETIDDLVQERDEICQEMYEVRLTLADAWNIKCAANHEKIWEVLRRTRELRATKEATKEEQKPYSGVVKSGDDQIPSGETRKQNEETNLIKCCSTDSADFGLGIQSLTQLIDERIDAKLKMSEKAESTMEATDNKIDQPALRCANLDQGREQNVIIHGLEEGNLCDTKLVEDIFEAIDVQHKPVHIMRPGQKINDRIRPLMLQMKNGNEQEEFMSKLWMLKNARIRFGKISITHDYTQEERDLIKKWVEEAKRRNTGGINEYRWKVRGTPRTELRLVKILSQE